MRAVQAPIVPIVGRWIGETPGTISLGQGLVSYGPPPAALEAARAFGDAPGDHLYGPVEGEPDLVAAIEHKLETENGIRVRPAARVVVTAGGNMAFLNAVLATGDPGDEYLLPAPYYFNHEMAVTIAGCRPVPVPTRRDFQLDLELLVEHVGASSAQAIRTGTSQAAEAIGSDEFGVLAPGKRADILAVRGNAMDDIGALRNILLVLKSGQTMVDNA